MALTSYQILAGIRDACGQIPEVNTCQIGLETPITPDAYPIMRVVMSVARPHNDDPFAPMMEIIVYYGEYVRPLKSAEIDAQHEWLMAVEEKLISAVIPGHGWRGRWVETVWDEDRVPGIKLHASRFEVWG